MTKPDHTPAATNSTFASRRAEREANPAAPTGRRRSLRAGTDADQGFEFVDSHERGDRVRTLKV